MDKKTRRKYSPEFKREAVMLASQSGQTITGVAQNLGVSAQRERHRGVPGRRVTAQAGDRGAEGSSKSLC